MQDLAKREGKVAREKVGGYPRPELHAILQRILLKFGNGDEYEPDSDKEKLILKKS